MVSLLRPGGRDPAPNAGLVASGRFDALPPSWSAQTPTAQGHAFLTKDKPSCFISGKLVFVILVRERARDTKKERSAAFFCVYQRYQFFCSHSFKRKIVK